MTVGALSYNGADGTLIAVDGIALPGFSGSGCSEPSPTCTFSLTIPEEKTDGNVTVNGYNMLAANMEFGDLSIIGDCSAPEDDGCLPADSIIVPSSICTADVTVDGVAAALAGESFEICATADTELFTLEVDIVIVV